MTAVIAPGQSIQLSDGRFATVKFVGQTHFAVGDWIGIELEDDSGKNDGSVQGERYFDCSMGRGMFVRPSTITILEQPAPPPPPPAAPPKQATVPQRKPSRASNVPPTARPSSVNDPSLGKRMSLNAPSPSPVPRASRPSSLVRSPTKSPTKQLGSTATSTTSSRTGTPSGAARVSSVGTRPRPSGVGSRTSMGPPAVPASRVTRQPSTSSSTGARTASATTTATRGSRLSSVGRGGLTRTASTRVRSGDYSGNERVTSPLKSDGEQPSSPVRSRTKALEKLTNKGAASTTTTTRSTASTTTRPGAGAASSGRTAAPSAANRKIEELETKLKVLERKRNEDREQMKELSVLQERSEKLENINKKVESKLQVSTQDNNGLRKQLKDAEERLEEIEGLQAEHESIMELATLDREMAEETAEVYKAELEALKSKSEEMELELEVLREENAEYSQGVSSEDRTSTGWLQLERTNERLREALIRLRDITQQDSEDAKAQIKDLQKDLEEFEAVKSQFQVTKEKLLDSETRAEDLRVQLDDSLGAAETIEALTYEKLAQTEEIAELKAIVEDLEDLKEIADELEINHVQNEKEMQEELDFRDGIIADSTRRAKQQDETIEDMEYTLSRFRELVTNLQSDLEDMRASSAVNAEESEQIENRSRAMMDLNQKLQISANKTQVKTIDLELQRMDAQEAQQHLEIVKMFLPESYLTDRDSVLALLRFGRLAFKANLLHGFVKERVNGTPHPGHEDDAYAGCDALDKLTWVSSMCDRFVNAISHCSQEQFRKYQGALYELEPVERALNAWIDGLKRDEMKEKQCAGELQRTIALMTHLGEVHITEGLESFADEVQMKAILMQSHLESAASSFNVTKDMISRIIPVEVLPLEGDETELAQVFAKKTEAVITQTRSAKVIISKAVRSLEDLKARSLSITPDTADSFEQCEDASRELAEMSRQIGLDLHKLVTEEGRADPYTYAEVQSTIHNTVMNVASSNESDMFSTYLSKLRSLTSHVSDLAAVCADLSQTQEFERSTAPWILRAEDIKAIKTVPVDAEDEIRQLKDHYNEARRAVAVRDENLSTATLRIDTLEARMRDANTKAERISGLEAEIEKAKRAAEELQKNIEEQDRELKTLETERDQWKKIAGDSKAYGDAAGGSEAGVKAGQERAVATAREMDALKSDIASLQAAVRYLREDNRRARTTEQGRYDWLAEPLRKPTPVLEQRRALVQSEGKDVLGELLKMTADARVFDLGSLTTSSSTTKKEGGAVAAVDRLAWRPAKSTPQYHAARQAEDLATWKSWQKVVVQKADTVASQQQQQLDRQRYGYAEDNSKKNNKETARTMRRRAAARLQIRLPPGQGDNGKSGGGGADVHIVGSREWERLQQGGRLAPTAVSSSSPPLAS